VNREVAELWSDAIGAPGTVIRYGHWGRPALVFPSEQGKAWDFENNGMVGAVAGLLEEGRLKLYCVDSYDAQSWSDTAIPVEERAQRHASYESWIIDQVVPWISSDCGGGDIEPVTLGCSLGAFHAANFALKRADLFPLAMCFSGNYDPASWNGWGEQARPRTSTTRSPTSAICTETTSTGCAAGSACCSSAARASGRTPQGPCRAPSSSPNCLPARGSGMNWICGDTTYRTTGRPGAHS
jgi:hypothetical protein